MLLRISSATFGQNSLVQFVVDFSDMKGDIRSAAKQSIPHGECGPTLLPRTVIKVADFVAYSKTPKDVVPLSFRITNSPKTDSPRN